MNIKTKLVIILIVSILLCGCNQIHKNKELTPLMWAVIYQRASEVDNLLEHGADPNVATPGGNTALIFAATIGNANIIQSLIQHGAKINTANNEGITPLIAAAGGGYPSIQLLLEKNANICVKTVNHLNAAQTADAWGNHDTAVFLENYQRAHNIHCENDQS